MQQEIINTIHKIIHERKSIYPYQYEAGAEIDDAIVWQILENANRAPTHKRTEPWRFTVFTGEGRKKFAELQVGLVKKYKPETGDIKLKKLAEYPLMASHIIAIGMKRNSKVPEIEEILAVGCAIENMFLTTTAYGLGSYLSTGGITYIEEAKEHFNLLPEDKLIGFLYIGKKGKLPEVSNNRGEIREKVAWIN